MVDDLLKLTLSVVKSRVPEHMLTIEGHIQKLKQLLSEQDSKEARNVVAHMIHEAMGLDLALKIIEDAEEMRSDNERS